MNPSSKKRSFFLGCAAVLLLQISCSDPAAQFDRNRSLWQASGILSYKMTVKIDKTGHAAPNGTVEIVVRDGRTESITRVENPSTGFDLPRWAAYDSIDDIFEFMEGSIRMPPEKMDVEYDPQYGFPKKLNIDPKLSTRDDELFFQVLEFESL